jgi:hypothetical protein
MVVGEVWLLTLWVLRVVSCVFDVCVVCVWFCCVLFVFCGHVSLQVIYVLCLCFVIVGDYFILTCV